MAELSQAQKNARKAKANAKLRADKDLLIKHAKLQGKLAAFNKLLKEGWAPKRKD